MKYKIKYIINKHHKKQWQMLKEIEKKKPNKYMKKHDF